MKNKVRRARVMEEVAKVPSKNDGTGVFGYGGGPGFDEYKQSRGPDTILNKTRETSFGTAKDNVNQLRRATTTSPNGRAKVPTTSTIKKTANNYRRARGTTATLAKKP
jgi:hypothetical protein